MPAATYYVSASGSDSNNGLSPGAAWQTLTPVNAHAYVPGDTILFNGGNTFTGGITITTSGAVNNPITFGSYGTGTPTISSAAGTIGLYAHNCGYISVANINFTGPGIATANVDGISFLVDQAATTYNYLRVNNVNVTGYYNGISVIGSAAFPGNNGYNDVRITNSNAYSNALNGIIVSNSNVVGKYSNVYVGYCNVYNNPGVSGLPNWSGTGILLAVVTNGTIEYCTAYGNGGVGSNAVGIWTANSTNVVIQFCESYNNVSTCGGFDIDGGSVNCTVQYCYSHGNGNVGCALYEYAGARTISGNVIRYHVAENNGFNLGLWGQDASDMITNSSVYNNTFYASTGPCIFNFGYSSGITVKNNIFVTAANQLLNQTTVSPTGVTYAYNDYYAVPGSAWKISWMGTTYTSLSSWGQDSQGLVIDPQLIGAGHGGTVGNPTLLSSMIAYKIQAGSPMIAAGIQISNPGTRDFYGNTIYYQNQYDIGANEWFPGNVARFGNPTSGIVGFTNQEIQWLQAAIQGIYRDKGEGNNWWLPIPRSLAIELYAEVSSNRGLQTLFPPYSPYEMDLGTVISPGATRFGNTTSGSVSFSNDEVRWIQGAMQKFCNKNYQGTWWQNSPYGLLSELNTEISNRGLPPVTTLPDTGNV